ncbi:MAG: M13 family metallopeptidase [Pseudomonadales bacterium]|nr:M13 family metallopeptidase [Pseudomonadales bacterium]
MLLRFAVVTGVALLSACAVAPPPVPAPPPADVRAATTLPSGLDLTGFDRGVRPQDDLYRFGGGSWLRNTPIPADKSSYGTFARLADDAETVIRDLIVDLAQRADWPAGSAEQKIGSFYSSYMDTERLEAVGLQPLAAQFSRIASINTARDVVRYIGASQRIGVAHPIAFFVSPDARDSSRYLAALYQNGLTMPDRDYYLDPDDKYRAFRSAFSQYVEQLLAAAGEADAASMARRITALETRIAEYHWTKVQNRDPLKTYNKMTLAELRKLAPQFDWSAMLEGLGATPGSIDVKQPSFVAGIGKLVRSVPVADWRVYFKFRLLDAYAPYLAKRFDELHFGFHKRSLQGVTGQQPRWQRAVQAMNSVMGELLGQQYVEREFSADDKTRVKALVGNLLAAFDQSIDQLDWMGPQTRAEARQKLAKIGVKIGYPDVWRDYSALVVTRSDLIGNMRRSAEFEINRQLVRIGRPVDRTEWFMTPQTVNAYYSPSHNEIVFPAAILRPPFFDSNVDDAVNYGGIGAVIGHEISHAFDDQGRQYDGDGNLRDWWSFDDAARFKKRAGALVAEFNNFTVLDGQKLNGELTLGENIGDLSGLAVAFKAYQLSLHGAPAPMIDGFSGPQRFFLGWAQIWRRNYRDAELLKRVLTDPHSPSEYRANGTASNLDAFQQAFELKPGDKLYRAPEERVKIW